MKFPSLFRIPQHKRFNFEPRYYDPVKEDIARRTAIINQEESEQQTNNYRSNISNAFVRNTRQSNKSGLIQFILVATLFGGFVGYLYYGNVVLYIFLGMIGLLLLRRLRTLFNFR